MRYWSRVSAVSGSIGLEPRRRVHTSVAQAGCGPIQVLKRPSVVDIVRLRPHCLHLVKSGFKLVEAVSEPPEGHSADECVSGVEPDTGGQAACLEGPLAVAASAVLGRAPLVSGHGELNSTPIAASQAGIFRHGDVIVPFA